MYYKTEINQTNSNTINIHSHSLSVVTLVDSRSRERSNHLISSIEDWKSNCFLFLFFPLLCSLKDINTSMKDFFVLSIRYEYRSTQHKINKLVSNFNLFTLLYCHHWRLIIQWSSCYQILTNITSMAMTEESILVILFHLVRSIILI